MPEDRRLAAIMFTDIVGYTELMGRDEDQAFQLLRKNRDIQRPLIKKYRGEWLKEMGDGILASFNSASDAVRCASEIQTACKKEGVALRIGIHEGEVVFEGGDVLGDGVNVASRLEELAEEGTINISGAVYKDIRNKAGIVAEFMEEKTLKGVDDPVKVYKVHCEDVEGEQKQTVEEPNRVSKKYLYYLIAGAVIAIAAILVWKYLPQTNTTELEKSIAILPLKYLSEDPSKQYYADGVMDAITGHLSKIAGLRVTPRTSVEQYRATTKTASVIGEELDVSYLLEGSFLMKDEQVRLTVQLVNAMEEDHVWFETYNRNWEDIFTVESEVAQVIAKEVEVVITPDVQERIEAIPTENLEAYDYFLQGNENYKSSWDSMNVNRVYKSIELFEKAIALDENFSFAYTGLGRSYWWLAHFEMDSIRSELWEKSYDYLNKAIELDANNGWAYAEMAVVLSSYVWDSTATRINLDKAIQLMPNDPNAYMHYFYHEFRLGNCDKVRWILEARKRFGSWIEHPYSRANLELLLCQGNYSKIISLANEYWDLGLDPQLAILLFSAATAVDSLEMANRIVNYAKHGINIRSAYFEIKAVLAAEKGNNQLAYQLIDSLELLPNYPPNTYFASIYAALSEKDKMYEYLNKGLSIREKELHDIVFFTTFDPYINESRFKEIKRKMWIPLEMNK